MGKILKTAFTLIELLVVIAIIGILSGLIVVTMSGITQKANIAKSQEFSNSLRNALMMNLVSEWKFDGSGVADGNSATTAYTQDSWSGIGSCTITGSPLVYSGNNCIYGSCLKFNGTSDYLDCGNPANLNSNLNSMTVELWVQPGNITQTGRNFFGNLYEGGTNNSKGYGFNWNTSGATWYVGDGTQNFISVSASGLNANTWYYIVGVHDYNNRIYIYLNGQLANSSPITGYTKSPFDVAIGGYSTGGDYFNGFIDNVRVYSATLPVSKIKEQYYAGLNGLLAKGAISKDEYFSRIKGIAFEY